MNIIADHIALPSRKKDYREAPAYPHIALDHFLANAVADEAFTSFPNISSNEWINYTHFNEKKYGNTKLDSFPKPIRRIVEHLNSDSFVKELSEFTGIPGLMADPSLEGGGLHQSPRGGFLNIHADFTVHPHHRNWRRRVNLLIYLNKNYEENWGGELEIWDRKMTQCCNKIQPFFNRAVIFNTDRDTFHGHPDPFNCPEGETRKSIALYYFTKEDSIKVQSTEYRAKPGEGNRKRLLIWMDKIALRLYDKVKRITGIDDKVASRILGWFSKR